MLEEVRWIVNSVPSPWGADNRELFNIYSEDSADDYECPAMVTDKSHGSCGQSRFGCWTCTVVKDDKSMRALIGNGRKWMLPLYEFRLRLEKERNVVANRIPFRRDGGRAVNDMGSYAFAYSASLFEGLLAVQRKLQKSCPGMKLVSDQELIAIQVNWYRDFNFTYQVSDMYGKTFRDCSILERDGR